jgi:hypothetical protein
VLGTAKLAFESRGGHLELIGPLQRNLIVEKTRDPSGELGEAVDIDAITVDCDAQNPALTDAGELDIVKDEMLGRKVWLDELTYFCRRCHYFSEFFNSTVRIYTANRWVHAAPT